MIVLFLGDVVGQGGCDKLLRVLPGYKKLKGVDVCIVNGENSAPGNGITKQSAEELFTAGADFITTGNHVYKKDKVYDYLDSTAFVIRPANFYGNCPGKGYGVIDKGRFRLNVINLAGQTFMEPCENPFRAVDRILAKLDPRIKTTIVDFHAEATSEKKAMGFYLDGRVSAVIGTHTHVLTADARVLPGGTAYLTDAGMTGAVNSVIGVDPADTLKKMTVSMPVRFNEGKGEFEVNGCLVDIDENTGRARSIETVQIS